MISGGRSRFFGSGSAAHPLARWRSPRPCLPVIPDRRPHRDRLVRSGTGVDIDEDGWDQFPTTVAAAMDDYLDRFAQDRDQRRRPAALHRQRRRMAARRPYTVKDTGWLLGAAADYLLEATSHTGRQHRLSALPPGPDRAPAGTATLPPFGGSRAGLPAAARLRAPLPQGGLDWQHAHPYILTHLADHAGATGHLGYLVDDPSFLLAANPTTLTASLRQSPRITTPRRTHLPHGGPPPRRPCRPPFSAAVARRAARRNHPRAPTRLPRGKGLAPPRLDT